MMTSQIVTTPEMMAWRTAPMPLTMAMRQLPMAWKTPVIQEQIAPIFEGFFLLFGFKIVVVGLSL